MKKIIITLMTLSLVLVGLFTFPVSQVSANPITHFYDDFESGLSSEWNTTGQWHVEDNDTSDYPIADVEIPSGSHYCWFGDNSTGSYDGEGFLTLGPLDMSTVTGKVELSFRGWFDHYNEYLDVAISNDGIKWNSVMPGKFPAQNVFFSPSSFDVSSYFPSASAYFRFRFNDNTLTPSSGFGWRIDNVKLTERPSFDILLGYTHTFPGETSGIHIEIWTAFSSSHVAQIVINITTPSGNNDTIHDSIKTFSANERWINNIYYYFNQIGEYQLAVIVIDELGKHHIKTGTIFSGDYIGIHTIPISGNQAFPGDTIEYSGLFYNYYTSDILVDIIVKMEINMVNQTLYSETNRLLTPSKYLSETYYNLTVKFTTTEEARHTFHFEVTDELGKRNSKSEAVDVGPYFDIYHKTKANQYSVPVGDFISFDIYIDPYLFVDTEVNLSITVKTPSDGAIILYEKSNLLFSPSGLLSETWIKSFSYQPLEPGFHDVITEVINASYQNNYWSDSFGWQAEETDPTLTITQTDKYPNLDDTEYINFSIQSHYAFEMVVDISIIMTTPSGNEEELHEETSTDIPAVGYWDLSISYKFDDYGKYEVEFLVVDNSDGTEWEEDSWWRVEEDESTSDTSFPETADTTVLVSPGFDNFTGLLTLAVIAFCLLKQRRRKRNKG